MGVASETRRDNLTGNRLLALLPAEEQALLRPHLRSVTFEREQPVIYADDPISDVYFPLSGLISLVVATGDGHTIEVAMAGREGFVGISVVLLGDPNPYDAMCQIRSEVLALPAATLQHLLPRTPKLHRLIDRYTLALLNQVARTAACNGLHTVEQRLARWLLLCRDRVESDTLLLTHEALARLLGTGRPFLSDTAQELQREGLIRYARGRVELLDPDGLERRACEDYRLTVKEYERLLGPIRG